MSALLKGNDVWKRAQFQNDSLEWHFVQLREGYEQLAAAADSRVIVESMAGVARQLTLSRFIWDVLRALHAKTPQETFEFALTFVGVFKAKSLNPTARHCKASPYNPQHSV